MALPTAIPSLIVISKVTNPGSVSGRLTGMDPENQALSFALLSGAAPRHGSVAINPDGTYTYTPAAGYLGTDNFSFRVTDAEGGTSIATVSISIVEEAPASITGSTGHDILIGGELDNFIDGGAGDDRLEAGAGYVNTLHGGAGHDVLYGGENNAGSEMHGGDGHDLLIGSMLGDDVLYGGAGDDFLSGEFGSDYLYGGDGNDAFEGAADPGAIFYGGAGNDVFYAWHEPVYGGTGVDTLYQQFGYLYDFVDVEVLIADYIEGELAQFDAFDTIRHETSGTMYLVINGSGAADLSDELGTQSVEVHAPLAGSTITTGSGHDTLIGYDGHDTLNGGAGNDTLYGLVSWSDGTASGNDRLNAGTGVDQAYGGDGSDTILFTGIETGDSADGGVGTDWLMIYGSDTVNDVMSVATGGAVVNGIAVGSGFEFVQLHGQGGQDRLTGSAGHESLYGGAGNDTIYGGGERDTLFGDAGNDLMYGGAGEDRYKVDSIADVVRETNATTGADEGGTDTVDSSVSLTLAAYVEHLNLTGTAALTGTGNALGNRLAGNTGNNTLSGLDGGDSLLGGAGNDVLLGGTGLDRIGGDAGNDSLRGGAGNDTLTGGTGVDHFVFEVAATTANGSDRVMDLVSASDRLVFEDAVFTKLLKGDTAGHVLTTQVRFGTAAADANDFLVYTQSTGQLFYDADGSGAGAKALVATLNAGQVFAAGDLFVM